MPARLIKILFIIAIIAGVVSYLFYFNPHTVTFVYGREQRWEAPLALLVIVIFCLGAISAALLTALFGIGNLLEERRKAKRERIARKQREELVYAREMLAAGDVDEAEKLFDRMVMEDPDNTVARVMLVKTIAVSDDLRGALTILDEARQSQRKNIELLVLGADINEQLGNFTGAYDNIAIALSQKPDSELLLRRAVSYATKLNRLDDAISHQRALIQILPRTKVIEAEEQLADLELQNVQMNLSSDPKVRYAELQEILTKHRDFAPAHAELASLENAAGKPEAATKMLSRSYKTTGDPAYLRKLSDIWLDRNEPARAVSAVQDAVRSRDSAALGDPRGQVFFIDLLLRLEMVEPADGEYRALENTLWPGEYQFLIALVKARLLKRHGRAEAAYGVLKRLIEQAASIETDAWTAPDGADGAKEAPLQPTKSISAATSAGESSPGRFPWLPKFRRGREVKHPPSANWSVS